MPARRVSHALLAPLAHSIKRTHIPRSCIRPFFAPAIAGIPLAASTSIPSPVASTSTLSHAHKSAIQDLTNALEDRSYHSRVWAIYSNLLSTLGSEPLPLEIHQHVLRRCTPSLKDVRVSLVRRLASGRGPGPHPSEARFQTIMQNIRASGAQPTLDDYNFVLQQFGMVGHARGAVQVYKELKSFGLVPDAQTFAFCFRALAFRITLPVRKAVRDDFAIQIQAIFNSLMNDMQSLNIPYTVTTLDLTLRILKETLDQPGFYSLMRWAYGIDLDNPDRIALEYADTYDKQSVDGTPVHRPFPFTTAALNTTIDILGGLGDVSKLVQAFEVLTQPLTQAGQQYFNSFEGGEDDDFGVSADSTSSSPMPQPPWAPPNTTTYSMLLRHVCRLGHPILARHYLNQAIALNRQTSESLRQKWNLKASLNKNPRPDKILAPQFALCRSMLTPVLGESNKDKNRFLMHWLSTKIPAMIRIMKQDVAFFELESGPTSNSGSISGNPSTVLSTELDLGEATTPQSPPPKYFDVNLHLRTLKRNILDIEDFSKRLDFVLGRTTQRVKERLGRRVWQGKDVFFRDSPKGRVVTTKENWKEVVNFQPRKDDYVEVSQEDANRMKRGHHQYRSMSTSARVASGEPRTLWPPISRYIPRQGSPEP
ncbi:hypothetical protein M413DRAFT_64240 [Hebeloma cylindrosporum]|uniref:Uncharacterized protein n=1 Tax=Hebeloma cylindrosporum TaxID=76867 RepID=A0A0C3CPM2_HEBCY|nr:hypothetical protein M413DRAFT_64240 [Hebeloma cylindrosporum h7]